MFDDDFWPVVLKPFLFFIAVYIAASVAGALPMPRWAKTSVQTPEISVPMDPGPIEERPRLGYAVPIGTNSQFDEEYFNEFKTADPQAGSRVMLWSKANSAGSDDRRPYAITAFGLDKRYHIVNAYLVGIRPFESDNPWLIVQTVASRMRYSLDSRLFDGGYQEVWQTSRQAYRLLRGDCEDHAILLADWLIDLGFDASVVVGKYKRNGHAWVICKKDGKVYLLDATSKRSRRTYPLAASQAHYHAYAMFNRDLLWLRASEAMSSSYEGNDWFSVSTFYPTPAGKFTRMW